jgi:transposase
MSRYAAIAAGGTASFFAVPPWDKNSPAWQSIDARVPEDHLARQILQMVERLDLKPLERSYQAGGSQPLPPQLMLKMLLYEIQSGHSSPADWFRDSRGCDIVKWLMFGLQPSRASCYEFRDRLQDYWDSWNIEVLQQAIDEGHLTAKRAAQDGTLVAANASRHRLLKQPTLDKRVGELDEAITADEMGQPLEQPPRWMARKHETRLAQRERYAKVQERMAELQAKNAERRSCKRQKPEKIVVSPTDPEAACGRDKLNVFRPLYNMQVIADLDSSFILAFDTFDHATDAGTLEPMLKRTQQFVGHVPPTMLADSGYASAQDLKLCEERGITLYAPVGENDYTERNGRQPGTNQSTAIPKTKFAWNADEQVYICPTGHTMQHEKTKYVKRAGGRELASDLYRCSPDNCRVCPLARECTPNPEKGRTVSRLQYEELVEALRARMKTPDGKALYRLRAPTIERLFADQKQHRNFRMLTGRGLKRAKAQLAATVLVHNLLTLYKAQHAGESPVRTTRCLAKIAA